MAAYTTIDDPSLYFTLKLYTSTYSSGGGTGATINVTLDATDDFAVDLVWIKCRSVGDNHLIADRVRGANKNLHSNTNDTETTNTDEVTAFGDDGFTVGNNDTVNRDGASSTYVAWCWKESATAGFDIVTATGTGSAKTISHSLSAVPHVIFSKEKTGSANDWVVYHHKNTSAPETDKLILNETNATSDDSCWNDTSPTSSVFSVSSASVVNRDSSTYVYYLWSEKQGFSKCGGYTGNGNADGPFIYTGFRPAFVMTKATNASDDWSIADNKRDPDNVAGQSLRPNSSSSEDSSADIDILSNGFKVRQADSHRINYDGDTFIYMAFAEAPFVNSNGVPCNAR